MPVRMNEVSLDQSSHRITGALRPRLAGRTTESGAASLSGVALMKHFGVWTALCRVFVPWGEKEGGRNAPTNLLSARCRRVLEVMPVAIGCQNLTIPPHLSRFHVIDF